VLFEQIITNPAAGLQNQLFILSCDFQIFLPDAIVSDYNRSYNPFVS
jgi:hypothetical protein